MLTSLEIKNFRAFSHLVIERLGRVNLIVGKNNVGKTTLLEALQICGSTQVPLTIRSILEARNEVLASSDLSSSGEYERLFDVTAFWHGREASRDNPVCLSVGTADAQALEFYLARGADCLQISLPNGELFLFGKDGSSRFLGSISEQWLELPADVPCLTGNVTEEAVESAVASWWDAVWLTERKHDVLKLARSIARIEDVIYVKDPRYPKRRMARARLAGSNRPVPLAAMGDGVTRLVQIALVMEYTRYRADQIREAPGEADLSFASESPCLYSYLLIDEVDTGIHHTMHPDLWRFIFRAARSLDIQVFATAHSLDCLRGFAEAAAEDEEADAQVIRLERIEGQDQTGAVVIDREGLPIVVRNSIEVR